jgi:hypothetical protein
LQDVERRLKGLESLPLGEFFSVDNNNNNTVVKPLHQARIRATTCALEQERAKKTGFTIEIEKIEGGNCRLLR